MIALPKQTHGSIRVTDRSPARWPGFFLPEVPNVLVILLATPRAVDHPAKVSAIHLELSSYFALKNGADFLPGMRKKRRNGSYPLELKHKPSMIRVVEISLESELILEFILDVGRLHAGASQALVNFSSTSLLAWSWSAYCFKIAWYSISAEMKSSRASSMVAP